MMTLREALEPIAAARGDHVVITTMGSVGVWPELSDSPLDFHYIPSSMGQGVPLALGLALARPGRGVIVLCGDGSLLMNLGCLVTLGQYEDVPVYVVLIDNGLYEVTGGQPVPGPERIDGRGIDYEAIARGAGISRVLAYSSAEAWAAHEGTQFSVPGPCFIHLIVAGERGKTTPTAPRPMAEQIARLRAALGVGG